MGVAAQEPAMALVEQDVWRAVHREGAAAALSTEQLAALRIWAAYRLRDHRYAAIATDRPHEMRPSFVDAIRHAARDVAAGLKPE